VVILNYSTDLQLGFVVAKYKPNKNHMLELFKEAKECIKENPIECLKETAMLLSIFATGYFMLIVGSALGLQ
jgi:hypothetical protein